MKEFSDMAGYKINTQKSILFLHTGSEQSKNEINKENNTIFKSSKKHKILWNTFNKSSVKLLYWKPQNTVERIKDFNQWDKILCSHPSEHLTLLN